MNETQRRKAFQRIKTMSNERFWSWMNVMHTRAYAKAEQHYIEAMSCHPRISKTMVDEVKAKAVEIREQWDGMATITLDETEGAELQTITEGKRDATRATTADTDSGHGARAGDRRVRPGYNV